MTPADSGVAAFESSLRHAEPPAGLDGPLLALWHAGRQSWDSAHGIVQDLPDRQAAWVHAYLHRVEGDLGNARYWYSRADQPVADDELRAEWRRIVSALLAGAGAARR